MNGNIDHKQPANLSPEDKEHRRQRRVEIRTEQANNLKKLGYKVQFITDGHVCVDDVLDLYLAHGKWHDQRNNTDGRFYRVRDAINEVFGTQRRGNVTKE